MRQYESNEEFFGALRELIEKLDRDAHQHAAEELRRGFSCLNGLTDGWALLMESIDRTLAEDSDTMQSVYSDELKAMLRAVKKAVYRT